MKSFLKKLLHLCGLIVTVPFSLAYILIRSDSLFAGQGQLLSLIPGKIGSYLRVAYYRMTLEKCSREAYIGFGSFFAHPEAEMGKGVYVGDYCILGMVKIGDYTTIGSNVHILSGKHQHGYKEIGKPIQEQKGFYKKISIGENCWIGSCAVIMADVGKQNVIGAGSVVVKETKDYEVIAGNPARTIKGLVEDD